MAADTTVSVQVFFSQIAGPNDQNNRTIAIIAGGIRSKTLFFMAIFMTLPVLMTAPQGPLHAIE
jgi:hypothetical protein